MVCVQLILRSPGQKQIRHNLVRCTHSLQVSILAIIATRGNIASCRRLTGIITRCQMLVFDKASDRCFCSRLRGQRMHPPPPPPASPTHPYILATTNQNAQVQYVATRPRHTLLTTTSLRGGDKTTKSANLPQLDSLPARVSVFPGEEKRRQTRPIFAVAHPALGIIPGTGRFGFASKSRHIFLTPPPPSPPRIMAFLGGSVVSRVLTVPLPPPPQVFIIWIFIFIAHLGSALPPQLAGILSDFSSYYSIRTLPRFR